MRIGNVLFSAVHFFFIVVLFLISIFFLVLANIPQARLLVENIFREKYSLFGLLWYFTFAFSCILFWGLYLLNRRQYYQLRMKFSKAEVEESLIREYIEKCWKEFYPKQKISSEIFLLHNQKIEILLDASKIPLEEQPLFLESIEKKLGRQLADQLGYEKEFLLTVIVK